MGKAVMVVPTINYGTIMRKFGANFDIDAAAAEDIISAGGDAYLPAAAVAGASINITSDSAADDGDPAGTGARTITIYGLDASYLEQSETITLNGVGAVHPVNAYIRIYRAFVATVGSGLTNAGNITIADGTGTFAYIPAGYGQTEQACYTVPANYRQAWLSSFDVSCIATAGSATSRIGLLTRALNGAWLVKELFNLADGESYHYDYMLPIAYAPKTDIKLRVMASTTNNLIFTGGFELWLEP